LLEFITYGTDKIQTLLLIAFRAGGLFIAAPFIGHRAIPATIKAGFSLILGLLLIPVVSQVALPPIDSIWMLALLGLKEMLVGFIVGLFFTLAFIAVKMGGNIVGYQIGLIIANVLDPESNSQVSIVGEFWYAIALLIFLAIDGHHAIISAFADSYKAVPIGVFNFSGPAGEMLIRFSAFAFVMAIKLAAPVIITLFLVEVAMGVVARTVPQMNIFIVGIPLKIGIGFLVLASALPVFKFILARTVNYLDGEVVRVLYSIGTT